MSPIVDPSSRSRSSSNFCSATSDVRSLSALKIKSGSNPSFEGLVAIELHLPSSRRRSIYDNMPNAAVTDSTTRMIMMVGQEHDRSKGAFLISTCLPRSCSLGCTLVPVYFDFHSSLYFFFFESSSRFSSRSRLPPPPTSFSFFLLFSLSFSFLPSIFFSFSCFSFSFSFSLLLLTC